MKGELARLHGGSSRHVGPVPRRNLNTNLLVDLVRTELAAIYPGLVMHNVRSMRDVTGKAHEKSDSSRMVKIRSGNKVAVRRCRKGDETG